ncbi:hypothetical protein AUP68_10224 [Ilyonectria robusta]
MEPLSALGVASGVITFVDFAWKLIVTAKEAHDDIHGATVENLELERVHGRMKSILESLATLTVPKTAVQGDDQAHVDAENLSHLVASSKKDCEQMLKMLATLKVKQGGRRRWKSVAMAFKSIANKPKLEAIHERLDNTREAIQCTLSIMVSKQVLALREAVNGLVEQNERLRLGSDEHIDQLTRGLDSLEITDTGTLGGLCSQIHHCHRRLPEIQFAERVLSLQQDFIASLHYDARPVRHEEIHIAYQNTFNWACEWGPFKRWLLGGDGIFWISGKPGSGKSTLMKFLADNPATSEYLTQWAHPETLMTAAHYFWISGSQLQKSYVGLLRSLLFEILTAARDAIPSICPERWKMMKGHADNPTSKPPGPWTVSELSSAMHAIAKHASLGTKICLFVDGLDEYNGDHVDLCNILKSLAESQNIKMCVSSRPWNVFDTAFGGDQTRLLSVHELTRSDIATYARGQLQTHPKWNNPVMDEIRKDYLIEQVCERAEGVFLWVYLVTGSLRAGFTNEDEIDDLQKRIEALPTDLEKLFQHILDHLDPVYHQKSAEIIEVAINARGKLSPQIYGYHEMDHDDEEYVLARRMAGGHTGENTDEFNARSVRRINALTSGLLEVRGGHTYMTVNNDGLVEESKLGREFVDFLHRTVGDFFATLEGRRYLARKVRPEFDVFLALTKAAIASVQMTGGYHWTLNSQAIDGAYSSSPVDTIKAVLQYASQVQPQHCKTVLVLLDEFEGTLVEHATGRDLLGQDIVQLFRNHVFQFNLTEYAAKLLQKPTTDIDASLTSALHDPFPPEDLARDRHGAGCWADDPLRGGPFYDMLATLLESGVDPNLVDLQTQDDNLCEDDSTWVEFLKRALKDMELREDFSESMDFSQNLFYRALNDGIFKLLLSAGADPNARLTHRGACQTAFSAYLSLAFSPQCLVNGFRRHHAGLEALDQTQYLDTLESFLDAGADFSICFSYRGIPAGREHDPLREFGLENIPIWELDFPDLEAPESVGWVLCKNLRWQHHSYSGRVAMPNGTLLFGVAKTILARRAMDDAVVSQLSEAVTFTFPPHMARPLLKTLQSASGGGHNRQEREEEGTNAERGRKRICHDSNDGPIRKHSRRL